MKKGTIDKITWSELKPKLLKVNTHLAKILDKISPGDTLPLYRVRYPYGATIIKQGNLYVPNTEGSIVPITDNSVPLNLKKSLSYAENGLPSGVIINKGYEVYIETQHNPLPVIIANPGSTFALWKHLEPKPSYHPVKIFNITSGARNIFMLPNISDAMYHKNLKRDYNVHAKTPDALSDHWKIFSKIINTVGHNWYLELVFFTNQWIEKIIQAKEWRELYLYLLEYAWMSSGYDRNQVFYDHALSIAIANRNLKPNPYLLDTVRHLLSITLGTAPAFKPATDESLAPIKLIQEAYVNSYGLKKYLPTLIHPTHFSFNDKTPSPVYYSLQFPTIISFSPRSRKLSNTLHDLRELKHIMNTFIDEIRKNHIQLDNTVVSHVAEKINYEYYHSKLDRHDEIAMTDKLIDCDPNYGANLIKTSNGIFANNGSFIRGCVKISKEI